MKKSKLRYVPLLGIWHMDREPASEWSDGDFKDYRLVWRIQIWSLIIGQIAVIASIFIF